MQAHVTPFFHASTSTWSYLVRDPASGEAAVIDAPLDFDQASGEVGHASAAAILEAAARVYASSESGPTYLPGSRQLGRARCQPPKSCSSADATATVR